MKITLQTPAELGDIATRVARLVGTPAMPILAGVLLSASADGTVTVTGSNQETTVVRTLAATVHEPGRAVLSARLAADVAKTLAHREAVLACEDGQATLTCGASTARLPLLPAEDYPPVPTVPAAVADADGDALGRALATVEHARAPGELATMTGVHLTLGNDQLTALCTDRYRFAVAHVPVSRCDDGAEQLLRVEHAGLADAARAARGRAVRIHADESLVGLSTEVEQVLLRQLAGEANGSLLATAQRNVCGERAAVSCGDLLGMAQRAAVHHHVVAFTAGAGELSAITLGGDSGGDETIPIDYTGPAATWGMSVGNVVAALRALDAEQAQLTVPARANAAMRLVPCDEYGTARVEQEHILAPMAIPGG